MSEENKRSLGASEELTSSECLDHADKEVRHPERVRWFHEKAYREAFPDTDVTVEEWLPLP
jgi:hypothetical protein